MSRWPKDSREQLVAIGLLKPAGTVEFVRCPACDKGHKEKPVIRKYKNGTVRFFVPCPEVLRAEVQPDELQQFAIDIELLANGINVSLSLSGTCKSLASDRVWRCGRWTDQGVVRDVLFARGLRRNDATEYRRAITGAHKPIVFVASELPDPDFWKGKVPPLIQLSEVARLNGAHLFMETNLVFGLIRHADETGEVDLPITLDRLKGMIRTQTKAVQKKALEDDWLVSAYKQCGSYRKAATFLSEQSGREVTKDHVFDAVKRAGGREAVVRGDDSESVVRTVSSKSRDTPMENRD